VVPVAINLSARNLYDPKLLERIEAIVGTWGIDPKALEIEITEGALVEDTQAARTVLARLSALCGKIYIDDFGTGYSSLSYLVSLPVHALKIDRAFVIQMSKSRQARAVVESVISMAHALGLRVVAEGVETAEDAQLLRELGCDEAQGYFFGRPVPPADFGRFLT
jgi:EAL domain-containing protein (putative c-di-GMP-specific phosphodiesterase class I)